MFERVAGQVATPSTWGAWLRGRLLLAVDGFEVDVPDTEENAAEFGYAGSGEKRSAFPKLRVVALAECGTPAGFRQPARGRFPPRPDNIEIVKGGGEPARDRLVLMINARSHVDPSSSQASPVSARNPTRRSGRYCTRFSPCLTAR
ncbi:hypothetical protein AB1460_35485, partial [Parafrankia sp. FMc2]